VGAIYISDIVTSEIEGIYKKISSSGNFLRIKGERVFENKCKGYVTILCYINGEMHESLQANEEPQCNESMINHILNREATKIVEQ
jgi:hypothetical protein